jgi:aspartate aminotransferase-like enzyme
LSALWRVTVHRWRGLSPRAHGHANPIRDIIAVGRAHHRLVLVDAVASLVGTDLKMDDQHRPRFGQVAGRCAGLGIVARAPLPDRSLPIQHARSWYLDRRWQCASNWVTTSLSVTMPTNTILLRSACAPVHDGLDAHPALSTLASRLRRGLEALDLTLFVPEELMAPVLTAAYCPPGVKAGEIVSYLEREHRIKITAGFGEFRERVIRIGHMGGAITEQDIDMLLTHCASISNVSWPAVPNRHNTRSQNDNRVLTQHEEQPWPGYPVYFLAHSTPSHDTMDSGVILIR